MGNTVGMDASLALQEADQHDLVRKTMAVSQLRQRLGDTKTEEQRLRESCEGFESIFIQKMWEQMRKNVSKEGYLHSKDEESYQSLFDVELAKKMTEAGGIGLADMLYEQLSQKLTRTARATTTQGGIPVSTSDVAALQKKEALATSGQEALTIESLYTPLDQEEEFSNDMASDEAVHINGKEATSTVDAALASLREELGEQSTASPTTGEMYQDMVKQQELAAAAVFSGKAAPEAEGTVTGEAQRIQAVEANRERGLRASTWQGNGPVSAKPGPVSGRRRLKSSVGQEVTLDTSLPQGKPMQAAWPHPGKVVTRFGWDSDSHPGQRRWNSGVQIEAAPGDSVTASLDGTVVYAGPREGYGNTVVLQHKEGYLTYYGNVEAQGLKQGDSVLVGTEFAKVARHTGAGAQKENFAPLYFEIKRGEMALNPEKVLARSDSAAQT